MNSLRNVEKNNLPKHIAIIMDGNGRWAKKRGNIRLIGHKKGVSTVNEIVTKSAELGIECLTLYAFSTENWNRPAEEVSGLMDLLVSALDKNIKKIISNNVQLKTIGDIDKLPLKTANRLKEAIIQSENNTGLKLILALNYSSRWEITEATKAIAEKCKTGELSPEDITDKTISENLSTAAFPDPELLIRTSGEFRISNFLLWQIAYTELYFTDILWPDFTIDNFLEAIQNFQTRERRFGKTGEQVK